MVTAALESAGETEQVLGNVHAQHLLQFLGTPPVARLGIVRLYQRAQLPPRHHLLHLLQKHLAPRFLRVAFKSGHHLHRWFDC